MRDFYKVLGISPTATSSQIQAAYRKLVLEFHPDRNPGSTNATEMLKMINEAYETLSDPQKRHAYDKSIKNEKTSENDSTQWIRPEDVGMDSKGEDWGLSNYLGPLVSPFIKRIILIDLAIACFFVLLTLHISPTLPKLPDEARIGYIPTWIDKFIGVTYVQVILAGVTAYFYIYKKKQSILVSYLFGKCFVFVWLVTGILGLSTIKGSLLMPSLVLLWNCIVIAVIFVYKLDQETRGRE